MNKSKLIYFIPIQNSHRLELWYLSKNLLILEFDESKTVVKTVNLKTNNDDFFNLDEHKLIKIFNKLANRKCFKLKKSFTDFDSERGISIYQDDTGTIHLMQSCINVLSQSEIDYYTNNHLTSIEKIKSTFTEFERDYCHEYDEFTVPYPRRSDRITQQADLFSSQGVPI